MTEIRYPLAYFGDRWDSGIFDGVEAEQIPTPVGRSCLYCTDPIQPGDRGVMRGLSELVEEKWVGSVHPIHAECDMRSVMGGPAHLQRRCSCYGRTDAHEYPGTSHDEALEVLRLVNEKRAWQGLGPMW